MRMYKHVYFIIPVSIVALKQSINTVVKIVSSDVRYIVSLRPAADSVRLSCALMYMVVDKSDFVRDLYSQTHPGLAIKVWDILVDGLGDRM